MPWGSRKTWAAILAAERLAPADEPVAHLVPNARHVHMARREWRRRTDRTVPAVCAPPTDGHTPQEQHQGYDRIAHDTIGDRTRLGARCPDLSLRLSRTGTREPPGPAVRGRDPRRSPPHRLARRHRGREDRLDSSARPAPRSNAVKRIGLSTRPGTSPPPDRSRTASCWSRTSRIATSSIGSDTSADTPTRRCGTSRPHSRVPVRRWRHLARRFAPRTGCGLHSKPWRRATSVSPERSTAHARDTGSVPHCSPCWAHERRSLAPIGRPPHTGGMD